MVDATVYFATNRKGDRTKNPTEFTEDIVGDIDSIRLGSARFENVDLDTEDLDALGESATISVAAESLREDASKSRLGSQAIFAVIREEMVRDKKDLLLFIHGYNYTFRQAIARAAQLGHWLGEKPMVVLVFCWPSLGKGVAPQTYKDERRRAEASGVAIGRLILKAADFIRVIPRGEECGQRMHLLAHSMGNWALRGAVQSMRTFVGNNIPPLFSQVLLMAADEDRDTLSMQHKQAPLLRGAGRITVYSNQLDQALKASDWAMGNPDRLGHSGPDDFASLPEKVVSVSVATVVDEKIDPTGHQYYRSNTIVRKDMLAVLSGFPDETIEQICPRVAGRGERRFVLEKRND